jgi:hypothetical protein
LLTQGPGGIHHGTGRYALRLSIALDFDLPQGALAADRGAFRPCADDCATVRGITRRQRNEARVLDPAVGVFVARDEIVLERLPGDVTGISSVRRRRQYLAAAEVVVEKEAEAEQGLGARSTLVRQHKTQSAR